MDFNQQLQQSFDTIRQSLVTNEYKEADLLQALQQLVAEWMDNNPESFFQKMYILDIAENKLAIALQSQNATIEIAQLILDRQVQKFLSRKEHQATTPIDKDLEW